MPTSTLTSKGQVTIPKTVRDRLGLTTGDLLLFRFTPEGSVILESAGRGPLGRLPGLLRHLAPEKPVSIEAMSEAVRDRAREKHRPRSGR
ncbi:MAG: AbrB/MazE/SpoVT family DNA-binding domain-containing protein [Thermoanaerobaculia bacterium]|nr:AbrB/MazE/SpoVT family DNA-binding domain-containing protein [Thermoanaerobaculia bacterium]